MANTPSHIPLARVGCQPAHQGHGNRTGSSWPLGESEQTVMKVPLDHHTGWMDGWMDGEKRKLADGKKVRI